MTAADDTRITKSLRLWIWLGRILGYFPYSIVEGKYLKYSKFEDYFHIIVFVLLYIAMHFTSRSLRQNAVFNGSKLQQFVHMLYILVNIFCTWLIFLIGKYYTKHFVKMFDRIYKLEEYLKANGVQLVYRSLRRKFLFYILLEYAILTIYSIIYMTGALKYMANVSIFNKAMLYFMFYFTNVNQMTVSISFGSIYGTLRYYFIQINKHFERNISEMSLEEANHFIKTTLTAHQKICELSRLANQVLTFQFLTILTQYLVMFTSNAIYVGVTIFSGDLSLYVGISAFWICYCVVKVCFWANMANRCTKASTDIINIASKTILNRHINRKNGIEKMLMGVYLQLFHEKVTVTVGKSIVMDKALLFSFASAVSTYIVILIQLKYDQIN